MEPHFSHHRTAPAPKQRKQQRKHSLWKKVVGWICGIFVLLGIWLYFSLGPLRPLFWNLPGMAGFFGEKTYLVLLQNENELRPGGGFLTGYGIVQVRFGFPSFAFFNSEDVAPPESPVPIPAPIATAFKDSPQYTSWVFRDSNFAPDFPENAQQAQAFLKLDPRFANTSFDGTIAINLHFLERLLDFVGPISFDGQQVSSANLFDVLEFSAKNIDPHDLASWQNRKNSFQPLATELISRLKHSPWRLGALSQLIQESMGTKDLQFFFTDQGWERKFSDLQGANEFPTIPFWNVNFANLGGRKGDRFLKKDLNSALLISPEGKMSEHFSLHLMHEGTYNLQSDDYFAYVRFIRPPGSTLQKSSGDFVSTPKVSTEPYGTAVSFFVKLAPGEEKLLSFDLDFPVLPNFSPTAFEIPLFLWKQSGTQNTHWDFTLRSENDRRFTATGCAEGTSRENVFFCTTTGNSDELLRFQVLPDTTPPLLQFARFLSLTEIEVRFSEEIPEPALSAISLQRVATGENISVREVQKETNKLLLTIESLSPKPTEKEKFALTISGLSDLSGNPVLGLKTGEFVTTIAY